MGLLLERDDELATLREAVATAVGGSGAVVVVSGPAGIGKSALLRAASRAAGTQVLRAVAGAHESAIPGCVGASCGVCANTGTFGVAGDVIDWVEQRVGAGLLEVAA